MDTATTAASDMLMASDMRMALDMSTDLGITMGICVSRMSPGIGMAADITGTRITVTTTATIAVTIIGDARGNRSDNADR